MNETYYVKTEEKEHTVKIQNEEEKFYSYDAELVENPTGTLVEKTITENGEYLPIDDDADGYSKVTVNTPIKTLIEKTITANGEYLPASDNADGYSKVTVDVQPTGGSKLVKVVDGTVTEITADDLTGATKLRDYSFAYCIYLERVVIPEGVTEIGMGAFNQCERLTHVSIPPTVSVIKNVAFYGCRILRTDGVYIFRANPPYLTDSNAFLQVYCPIYVPAGSVNAYKTATNWSSLANYIRAIPE